MKVIGEFLSEMKRLSKKGRCLHVESGERCNHYIDAHSIQSSGQLSKIEERGHVVRLSADISALRKNHGAPDAKLVGINKVTTFMGFCQNHDNELFEDIDNHPLIPNDRQIFLYAYRCFSREYFVKENAVNLLNKFKNNPSLNDVYKEFLTASEEGHRIALENLTAHKKKYHSSLVRESYHDMTYVCFMSQGSWNIQVSGILYPDYDFLGNKLQNIAQTKSPPHMLTFFTAPLNNGWAFVFAWHKSSSEVCCRFMSSLANKCSASGSPTDAIFRLIFSCCENHAIKPSWWDSLNEDNKRQIKLRAHEMMESTIPVRPNYLSQGLEGIADWEFPRVISTM